jgi:hypothetical protein
MANKPNSGLETHPSGGGAALNSVINANWLALDAWVNPAEGKTASQTTTALVASADIFTADDVGATIRFADGTIDTISAFVSVTAVTMTTSQTVASQAFELYRATATEDDALARALIKRPRLIAADDGKAPIWDDTLGRFVMGEASAVDANGNLYSDDAKTTPGAPASMTNGLYMVAGVAPTTNPANLWMAWVSDQNSNAGEAALNMESEDGVQHTFGKFVGIGTLLPTVELDVTGDVLADTFETNGKAIQVLDVHTGIVTSNDLAFPSDANVITLPVSTINTVSGVTAGARYTLRALGAVTLTDGANLVCRGGNITLAVDESVEVLGISATKISVSTKP